MLRLGWPALAFARTLFPLPARCLREGPGFAFVLAGKATDHFQPWLFLTAAALIQIRLLCNLFDGMVAIEGGFKTKIGGNLQ